MLKMKKIVIILMVFTLSLFMFAACGDDPDDRTNIPITDGFEGVFAGTIEFVSFPVVVTLNGDGTGSLLFGSLIDDEFTYEIDDENNSINASLKNDPETWPDAQNFVVDAVSEELLRFFYFGLSIDLVRQTSDFVPAAMPDAGIYAGLEGTFKGKMITKYATFIFDGKGFCRMEFGDEVWRYSIYCIKLNDKGVYTIPLLETGAHEEIVGTIVSADEITAKYTLNIKLIRQNV